MKKKPRQSKSKPFLDALSPGPSLIKQLASCNASVRSKSLRLLQTWLSTQTQLPEDEMKKLWKGLFYCLWHSDKTAAQTELINRITSLVGSLDLPLSIEYFTFFLVTLRREWNGIDHLRLDKFYLLIRRFMRSVFELMRKYNWDISVLNKFMEILANNAFLSVDKLLGNGVNYHIVSVFLDELKGCFVPVDKEVILALLKPFFDVLEKCEDKVMIGKVKGCVFLELWKSGRGLLDMRREGVEGEEYGDVAFGAITLTMGFSGRFYELGSAPACVQGNRKVIFGLHEDFLKLEKELEASGIEVAIPQAPEAVDDEDEVPELIPIEDSGSETGKVDGAEAGQRNHGSVDGNLEKCKKLKNGLKESKTKTKKKKQDNELSELSTVAEENESEDGNKCIIVTNGDSSNSKRDGNKKKEKKKKRSGVSKKCSLVLENKNSDKDDTLVTHNSDASETNSANGIVTFNESVISNLQKQFEKVAAEVGDDDNDDDSSYDTPIVTMKKKRKRNKNTDEQESLKLDTSDQGDCAVDSMKSADKSAKKVRFAMKNNLVWKPHSPLPPQSLRLPPSLTPRGSALKKGVPPGPIREMPPATKKVKKRKGRKLLRTTSPAIKRLRKLHALSI